MATNKWIRFQAETLARECETQFCRKNERYQISGPLSLSTSDAIPTNNEQFCELNAMIVTNAFVCIALRFCPLILPSCDCLQFWLLWSDQIRLAWCSVQPDTSTACNNSKVHWYDWTFTAKSSTKKTHTHQNGRKKPIEKWITRHIDYNSLATLLPATKAASLCCWISIFNRPI